MIFKEAAVVAQYAPLDIMLMGSNPASAGLFSLLYLSLSYIYLSVVHTLSGHRGATLRIYAYCAAELKHD